ncbi:MAG TPA: MerR family transcriptional regulator [Syntrophales bacterium]|nr:MerR family transcriptional regulator [Syntrophales bacterium]
MVNFNSKTVARITGLSTRQIDYWDRTHFIKPSVREAAGYGSARIYSFEDLVQLKVAKSLLANGISLQRIRKAVWYLRKTMPDLQRPLSDLKFLTDGATIFVLTKDSNVIIDTLKNGQVVFAVQLGQLIDELRGEIKELDTKRKYEVTVMGRKYAVYLHMDVEEGRDLVEIECPELPGVSSQSHTTEEALEKIRNAIGDYLRLVKKEKSRKVS